MIMATNKDKKRAYAQIQLWFVLIALSWLLFAEM